jgi:hypothetical protein
MAKALECPACGAKHRLDGLDSSSTFRCERCGQTLKVPASVPAAATSSGSAVAPPPPRRRTPGAPPAREVIAVSTPLSTGAKDGQPGSAAASKQAATVSGPRRRVHWYWRFAAWLVAVPIGFLITAWPAYEFNLIRKSDVLDIFVGTGTERYTRLAIGTLIWALITALLVQLLVEGGRWRAARRRRRHDADVLSGAGPADRDGTRSRRARSGRTGSRRGRSRRAKSQRAK